MKIRTGFVSNSSSSSFCVFGCFVDTYELSQDNSFWDDPEESVRSHYKLSQEIDVIQGYADKA